MKRVALKGFVEPVYQGPCEAFGFVADGFNRRLGGAYELEEGALVRDAIGRKNGRGVVKKTPGRSRGQDFILEVMTSGCGPAGRASAARRAGHPDRDWSATAGRASGSDRPAAGHPGRAAGCA